MIHDEKNDHECTLFTQQLSSAHHEQCIWRDNPFPDELLIPTEQELHEQYIASCASLSGSKIMHRMLPMKDNDDCCQIDDVDLVAAAGWHLENDNTIGCHYCGRRCCFDDSSKTQFNVVREHRYFCLFFNLQDDALRKRIQHWKNHDEIECIEPRNAKELYSEMQSILRTL